jgi:DNA-binding transcriptional MocR family regulator
VEILSPGLRVGFVMPPSHSLQRLQDKLMATTFMVSPIPVEIVATWLRNKTADKIIKKTKRESKRRQELVSQILPAELIHGDPSSYFVWIRLPTGRSVSSFTEEARRKDVTVYPAEIFAVHPGTNIKAVRFVIGAKNRVILKRQLNVLSDLLKLAEPRFFIN